MDPYITKMPGLTPLWDLMDALILRRCQG